MLAKPASLSDANTMEAWRCCGRLLALQVQDNQLWQPNDVQQVREGKANKWREK